ncbi:hypothetical protein CEB3_c35160 [Peptococcaceae bacterium CEB3]|nr:hypothetical protein CEB3_c35160 [Peptococcaceae bacterium CEB3]
MHKQEVAVDSAATIDKPKGISTEPQRVDFAHPELCKRTNPVSCKIGFTNVPIRETWIDLLIDVVELFLKTNPKLLTDYQFKSGRPLLMDEEMPGLNCKTLSNGKVILVNYGLDVFVRMIGRVCAACGVGLNDVIITYVPKSGGDAPVIKTDNDSARFAQQPIRDAFRAWLTDHNPEWSSGTVTVHYSDAYYLYNNERGVTLDEALTDDDGLQRAYDAIERYFINNPTQTNNPSGSARGYLRSLRMLKEFLTENHPELLNANVAVETAASVPDSLLEALNRNYFSGFRFDTTYINLLSNASGIEIDERMQSALKRVMFCRDDGIYFLLDTVADAATRKNIVDFADAFLEEYGCFEIAELYKLYEDKVNPKCIGNADAFERFYEQIEKRGVRCVQAPQIGNRMARLSNGNVWGTFKEVAAKIVSVITEDYYGSCNEDDLHTKFCAFSTDLLGKIIRNCATDKLIRVEINDSVCYQTVDALGLPENFSDVLAEILERLGDVGLEPSQEALHTAISLKLGVNFRAEFNLSDWDTYRRLVATFYKAEPRREWKYNIFGEVID